MIFPETRWTLIAKLSSPEQTREALGNLCQGYWQPVYAFLRREGRGHEDAQDITQSFFLVALKNEVFQQADKESGRLRSFLITALKNHLSNQHRLETALKRHPGAGTLFIGEPEVMRQVEKLAGQCATPAEAFDRAWLWSLLMRVMEGLRSEYSAVGKGPVFEAVLPWVMGDNAAPQMERAQEAGLSLSNFRVQIHRLRMRYRDAIRREVAATVSEEGEAEREMEYLLSISGKAA